MRCYCKTLYEMRCYCKILYISYIDRVKNGEVHAKIQHSWTTRRPDHHKETQTAVVWTYLPFIRSGRNHLVKGGRRQGRQKKRWEDIREWTGLEFVKFQRAAENREKWKKLVAS